MARAHGRASGEANFEISAALDANEAKALKRAIQNAGAAARKEVRDGLKGAGQIGQQEIQSRTPIYGGSGYGMGRRARVGQVTLHSASGASRTYRGRHTPGLLKKSTRLKIGSLRVTIYNSAKAVSRKYPGGYRYGKRIEFDPKLGRRFAFFYPGWAAAKARALAAFDKVLKAARDAYMR